MKIVKQIIVRQTGRRVISKMPAAFIHALCPQCGVLQKMILATGAAQMLGLSERRVFSLVEAGEFHIHETVGGRLFICFDSMIAADERKDTKIKLRKV